MKMYHLNPNDYGQGYFVLANSKEQALEFIVKSKEYGSDEFIGKTIDNLPDKYTMNECKEGEVVRHEIC
jgi:hypothetical protein